VRSRLSHDNLRFRHTAWRKRRLLAAVSDRWDVQIGSPFPLSSRYVAPAVQGGATPCVVKLAAPGDAELAREADVLAHLDGDGAVRLLARDDELGALLLERAVPGTPLTDELAAAGGDETATARAAEVLRRLWREPPPGLALRRVADLASGFDWYRRTCGTDGPLPASLVERAAGVFQDLVATSPADVLLHGDLHHGNVLRSARGWLAIDPKGHQGDPAADCATLLANPHDVLRDRRDLRVLLDRRCAILAAALDLDVDRVRGWGGTLAVLSEIWFLQDTGSIHGTPRRVARALLPA
jgi:streptomycin 6-kinase